MQLESRIKDTSAQDRRVHSSKSGLLKSPLIILVAVTGVAGLWWLATKVNQLASSDQSVSRQQVQIAQVERGSLQRDLSVQGRVVAANSPTLFAPSPGSVSLQVKAGAQVVAGELLAVIDSPELQSQYDQQKSQFDELKLEYQRQQIQIKTQLLDNQQQIEVAKVDLALAQKNIERAQVNIVNKVISQVDYETQQAELAKIELQHKHAIQSAKLHKENLEFELKAKQYQLERQEFVVNELLRQVERLKITSPLTGVVGNLLVNEKDAVAQNSALLTLVDLTAFEVEVSIPENYADDLGVGLAAEVQLEGQIYGAELSAISPEVTNGQVSGRLRFTNQIPTGLRQNQRISSRVLIESKSDVLKVRRGSFVETGGGRVAFVLQGDMAVKRSVEIGAHSINEIEIVSGLYAGEQIIISSIEQFTDSQKIYLSN